MKYNNMSYPFGSILYDSDSLLLCDFLYLLTEFSIHRIYLAENIRENVNQQMVYHSFSAKLTQSRPMYRKF